VASGRHRHRAAGDGGEITEQCAEAVDGQSVICVGGGLAIGDLGALGLGDDGGEGEALEVDPQEGRRGSRRGNIGTRSVCAGCRRPPWRLSPQQRV
jgi:hypothetical protein